MRRTYQVTSLFFIVVAAYLGWQSLRLKFYTSLGPGPGFFPFWLSVILGALSAIMLAQTILVESAPLPEDFLPSRTGWLRLAAITLALAASVVLMEPLGFRLTMLGFLLFLLVALGRQSLAITVPVALVGSLGVYHVFSAWLRIPLPVGALGF